MGSIGKEKGRGERKAQMHFLTIARRSVKNKNDHRMTFVASVQGIDAVSQNGTTALDIGAQHFHITVTRRGITEEIEKATLERSKDVQHCARFLVDKAAVTAGLAPAWAREVTMHMAYKRRLMSHDHEDEPEKAPVDVLIQEIGCLGEDQVSAVLDLLRCQAYVDAGADTDQLHSFASTLLKFCREEKLRRSKPVTVSLSAAIGGPKAALQLKGHLSPTVCDAHHLITAFGNAKDVWVPDGCAEASITVKGNGKFILSTTAAPEIESKAAEYLSALATKLQESWLQSTTCTEMPSTVETRNTDSIPSSLQPTLSIGVIGDVANGKSTLVKAISGKKTQQHSSEQQQHGITIRLGFANAAVLRCRNEGICGAYSFLPEASDDGIDSNVPTCSKCGHSTAVVKRFSLVDCPGHAELMATMLAGASAFDAVLLAAASNVPCPTPQARQHLEAIKMSGIMDHRKASIAIAQTKAELLADDSKNTNSRLSPEERLEHHAKQGRGNMVNSVAAEAPIFPVCAPMGLGLEAIAEWIANIPPTAKQEETLSTPRLTVLRSFDVNIPGKAANEMAGGVLGGTIQGSGSFALGQVLEVRPGLLIPSSKPPKQHRVEEEHPSEETKKSAWMKNDARKKKAKRTGAKAALTGEAPKRFEVQPLRFYCTSLMSGKNNLTSVAKGGLVAVGTSLDPFICADNRMVGSLVGPVGTLPPVWGPTIYMDNLNFVDLLPESGVKDSKAGAPSDLLKKGSDIRFHIGSATVKGVVVRVSKSSGKVEAHLDGPVCAAPGANIALEGKGGNGYCLVAHAKLVDGDVCLEGSEGALPSQNSSLVAKTEEAREGSDEGLDPVEGDQVYRKRFLEDLESCKEAEADTAGSRLSVPRPDIARDGGAHVILSNFGAIAKALCREPGHLVLYLQKEGGLSCVLAGDRSSPGSTTLRVKWRGGRNFAERFTSILKKYIRAYVTCNQCRGAVTELLCVGKTEQSCRHCNAKRFVPKL